MDTGAEWFVIGTPGMMSVEQEGLGSDSLANGPNTASERRMHTPVRPAAVKRRSNIHDEEPDTKKIILDDGDENTVEDKGLELDEVCARKEDEDVVCRSIPGRNLHGVYSNETPSSRPTGNRWSC